MGGRHQFQTLGYYLGKTLDYKARSGKLGNQFFFPLTGDGKAGLVKRKFCIYSFLMGLYTEDQFCV